MAKYATGKNAIGYCDRCGFEYPLGALKTERVAGRMVNLRTCPTCHDPDHPQNFQGKYPVTDAQALQNARPDPALAESRVIPS